jgi:hypothetical protein
VLTTITREELHAIAGEPYEGRGILHSEMALVIDTCRRLSISAVLESGRARAQSTYMLAKYLPDTLIASIEARPTHPDSLFGKERVSAFENVQLFDGDGKNGVVALIDQLPYKRIAVLLDGPKGLAALELLDRCFRRASNVVVGFIHDMRRKDHGVASPFRVAAEAIHPRAVFSDAPEYAPFAWMDNDILAAGGPVGPAHEVEYGSYGPTIGVFLNPALTAPKQTATIGLGV